jgi:5-methylcytosine-specific restriction endonuclease McrA
LESHRAADQRRRARKAGSTVEKFTSREIFERDGWRCGICRRKVNADLRWPDPLSASLDHIVPLSLDGGHTRANVRLAHLDCNVKRGNRIESEQLALIG